MNTFLDYLTVLAVAALLLAPSFHGALHDRRVDRQLRAAGAFDPGLVEVTLKPAAPVAVPADGRRRPLPDLKVREGARGDRRCSD
ncbi:hypothetical protein ACIRBY_08830 [Streptomyces sp. NPDC096136]|uniref:hypothetical protein n=1 Tax=Streptomyces sp. NPDC096136 TaxID=3366076 RepID=UPI003820F432